MKRLLRCGGLILALMVATLVIVGVFLRKSSSPFSDFPSALKQEVESAMQLEFPPSSRLLNFDRQCGLDMLIRVKVAMDRKELQSFLLDSPFTYEELDAKRRYCNNHERDYRWWRPGSSQGFISGQKTLRNTECLNILVDLDGEEVVVVYLEWFET